MKRRSGGQLSEPASWNRRSSLDDHDWPWYKRTHMVRTKRAATQFARFSNLLRDARRARRITQTELAARLKIGQQAVSSWERGTSRPETEALVLDLAAIFPEHDPGYWRDAAGYRKGEEVPPRRPPSRPVRPLLEVLPLDHLSFEQFQNFCALLLELLHDGRAVVNKFGVQGDTQDGIDIEVRFSSGRYETFQCKRERKFGPAKVQQVIQEHKVTCDRAAILLSRPATARARSAIPTSGQWDLWDADDIARKIRTLSVIKQKRILDTYFPAHRNDFLGVDDVGAFESAERHFARLLQRDQVFSHAWTLVGRDKELQRLVALTDRSPRDATLLVGSGGIGKSRLVRALADAYQQVHPDRAVLILAEGRMPSSMDLDVAAEQPTLIIVEDAHEHPQIRQLLATLAGIASPVRVLVTARPYAAQLIRSDVIHGGFRVVDDAIVTLEPLTVEQAESVAREILKDRKGPVRLARDIARVTRGSSLALVVGSYLVATARIHPNTLNNSRQFRDELFGRFRDALAGDIGPVSGRAAVRETLNLIALLQPIDPDAPGLATLAEQALQLRIDQVKRAIHLLYGAGVLSRRGRVYRIVPDLLAEYILEDACVSTDNGESTGYVERIVSLCDETQLTSVLLNVSKLDWRLTEADESQSRLANLVWRHVEAAYDGGLAVRNSGIEAVAAAAYYQPGRALAFYDRMRKAGHADGEFAILLKHAAMNWEHVEEATRRLWELGREDQRRLNQYPSHPIRILSELAAIEPGKPVEYSARIVGLAMRLIDAGQGGSGERSAFAILRAALATEGHTTEYRGASILMTGFGVQYKVVAPLRQSMIHFLIRQLDSADLPRAFEAATTFAEALRYPHGVAGRVPTSTERNSWSEEFMDTLRKIRETVESKDLDPFVAIQLQHAINWHAHLAEEETRGEARAVLDAIPKTLKYRVSLAFADGWGHLRADRFDDLEAGMREWQDELTQIGSDLVSTCSSVGGVLDVLRERLRTMQAVRGDRSSPGVFARMLATSHPQVADAICKAVLASPQDPLRVIFGEAICQMALTDSENAWSTANKALDLDDVEIRRSVAWAYGVRLHSGDTVGSKERTLTEQLVQSDDDGTVRAIVWGVAAQAATNRSWALATLLSAPIDRSPELADEVFATLMHSGPLECSSLSEGTVRALISKLAVCPSIDNHWIQEFVARASMITPSAVVEFLIGRIGRDGADAGGRFQPMPYFWEERAKLKVRESGDLGRQLRKIREWLFAAPRNAATEFWGPKLYGAVAGGYDEKVLDDLGTWTKSGDAAKFAVIGRILADAPRRFVFERRGFVVELLEQAAAMSQECLDGLRSSLWRSAMSGMRHGTPGSPFPEDEETRDRSVEALAQISPSSPAWQLFSVLKGDAEANIRWKHQDDERLLEE